MPRTKRKTLGGYYYHVINRSNGRLRIFKKRDDFLAFEKILGEAQERIAMRIFGYCIMSNHWHLLLRPYEDGDLSAFMQWLTVTHTMRHHYSHGTAGTGHLYQGRFKSFPVQADYHLIKVLKYIEANPLAAEIVDNAGDYPWSSYDYHVGNKREDRPFELTDLPEMSSPRRWAKIVHSDMPQADIDAINQSLKRGTPLGDEEWKKATAKALDLQSTINKRGRPRNESKKET
ncbi:MAG: transposase [Sedimentisphaeraceae bacterium JB056]